MSLVGKRIAGLGAGETTAITQDLGNGVGRTDRLRVRVDPLGQVLESDENNNSKELTIPYR